jgi:hypothetical protein
MKRKDNTNMYNEAYNGIRFISIDQLVTQLATKKADILPCERSCETWSTPDTTLPPEDCKLAV